MLMLQKDEKSSNKTETNVYVNLYDVGIQLYKASLLNVIPWTI